MNCIVDKKTQGHDEAIFRFWRDHHQYTTKLHPNVAYFLSLFHGEVITSNVATISDSFKPIKPLKIISINNNKCCYAVNHESLVIKCTRS